MVFTEKEMAAVRFSPLAASPAFVISYLIDNALYYSNYDWWSSLVELTAYSIFALPFSFVGMLMLGLPSYLLLKATRLNHPVLVAIIGAPLSYMIFRVLGGGTGYSDDGILIIFIACGLSVSITAAYIIRFDWKYKKKIKRDIIDVVPHN